MPGLDEVLGGGLPELACTLIAGRGGSGRTTLAQQIVFANASAERSAVYFCGPGEPPDRLQQHLERLSFFEPDRLDRDIHLVDVGPHFTDRDASRVLDQMAKEIVRLQAELVVVDLPWELTPPSLWNDIVLFLVGCPVTSLIIADSFAVEHASVADAVVWLDFASSARTGARTIEVRKVRGQTALPGAHTVQLSWKGLRVLPRWPTPLTVKHTGLDRLASGVEGVDRLLGGGVAVGGSLLVEGPSGMGKSILATQFVAECGHQGLPGLMCLFEERPDRFIARAEALELQLERLVHGGLVDVLSFRGRDVAPDEVIYLIQRAVSDLGAQNVVIDSTAGLELQVGRELRDCLWRLVDCLTVAGVTVWINHTPVAGASLAALMDDVLELSRVEIAGRRERRMEVVKASAALRGEYGPLLYEIGRRGLEVLPKEEPRVTPKPSNGHLVNYRYAAG